MYTLSRYFLYKAASKQSNAKRKERKAKLYILFYINNILSFLPIIRVMLDVSQTYREIFQLNSNLCAFHNTVIILLGDLKYFIGFPLTPFATSNLLKPLM